MPPALAVLAGLLLGLVLGMGVRALALPSALVDLVEPIGTLFINAIRMTVVPLVGASLVVGVASARDARTLRRLGSRTLGLFLVLLATASILSLVVALPVLGTFEVNPAAASALRESASRAPVESPPQSFGQWLVDLVPANPLRAAADAAMLPLIVFSVVFGFALNAVDEPRRVVVVQFFQGVADAMFVLVRWILRFAPAGVFALALALASRMGIAAAGALAYYVALVVILNVAYAILVLYPTAVIGGRIRLGRFARGALPAQLVGFSSRSSLASLPAMIEGARSVMGIPDQTAAFVLPLAASVFRTGGAIVQTVGVLFVAKLYDVPVTGTELLTVVATVTLTSFAAAGIPGGAIIAIVPALVAVDLPVEGVGVLLGADTIPDMVRTATNVTGSLTVTAVLARRERSPESGTLSPEP
jgi:Na+/H+-dicarboxylate symporter